MCREVFPSSRLLFTYRDVVATAKSYYRMSMTRPFFRLIMVLGYFSPDMTKMVVDAGGFNGSEYRLRIDDELTFGVLMSGMFRRGYLDLRRRGFDVSAVRYEDLVARPLDMCRVILQFCHLPVSLAERAVEAFDVDSQRKSTMAKCVIGHLKEPELTPKRKNKLNELLKKFGVPLIGEPQIMEGTLSCY